MMIEATCGDCKTKTNFIAGVPSTVICPSCGGISFSWPTEVSFEAENAEKNIYLIFASKEESEYVKIEDEEVEDEEDEPEKEEDGKETTVGDKDNEFPLEDKVSPKLVPKDKKKRKLVVKTKDKKKK